MGVVIDKIVYVAEMACIGERAQVVLYESKGERFWKYDHLIGSRKYRKQNIAKGAKYHAVG